jgi:hemolysin III
LPAAAGPDRQAAVDPREERLNSLTHAAGALASLVGAPVLVVLAAWHGDAGLVVGSALFGVSLVALYTVSALYHGVRSPRWRGRLQVLDHSAIYLLIAGTYSPFMLGPLRGAWGWSLFGVIWGLAVAGTVFKLVAAGDFRRLSTGLYLVMGWLAVIVAVPVVLRLPTVTLGWLVAGGVAYTAGTWFFHRRWAYAHTVWHAFVLAGSLCHGVAVATLSA